MVNPSSEARTALVHHWLVTMRGGERVFEALAELFPSADLFTLVHDKSRISGSLQTRNIRSSVLQRFPGARKLVSILSTVLSVCHRPDGSQRLRPRDQFRRSDG